MSIHSSLSGCQVQIEFLNKKQMEKFVLWFNKTGFMDFIKSKENKGEDRADSMSTDEEMDWGHYFEIE